MEPKEEPIIALCLPSTAEGKARRLAAQHTYDFTDVAEMAATVPALLKTIDALRTGYALSAAPAPAAAEEAGEASAMRVLALATTAVKNWAMDDEDSVAFLQVSDEENAFALVNHMRAVGLSVILASPPAA